MSLSVSQKIGLGLSANLIPDPGAAGYIRVGDAGISVCTITAAANVRVIADGGYPGQLLMLVNRSGSQRTGIIDSASALSTTLEDNEVALLAYTGDSAAPWVGIALKSTVT